MPRSGMSTAFKPFLTSLSTPAIDNQSFSAHIMSEQDNRSSGPQDSDYTSKASADDTRSPFTTGSIASVQGSSHNSFYQGDNSTNETQDSDFAAMVETSKKANKSQLPGDEEEPSWGKYKDPAEQTKDSRAYDRLWEDSNPNPTKHDNQLKGRRNICPACPATILII